MKCVPVFTLKNWCWVYLRCENLSMKCVYRKRQVSICVKLADVKHAGIFSVCTRHTHKIERLNCSLARPVPLDGYAMWRRQKESERERSVCWTCVCARNSIGAAFSALKVVRIKFWVLLQAQTKFAALSALSLSLSSPYTLTSNLCASTNSTLKLAKLTWLGQFLLKLA